MKGKGSEYSIKLSFQRINEVRYDRNETYINIKVAMSSLDEPSGCGIQGRISFSNKRNYFKLKLSKKTSVIR